MQSRGILLPILWVTQDLNRFTLPLHIIYIYVYIFITKHLLKNHRPLYTAKSKDPHYRPGQVVRVPGVWGSQISRQLAHECGNVVSLAHRPPLHPRKYFRYWFLLEAVSTTGPQCGREDCQSKIPMIPQGIEPATFWLVAQCLNQLVHRLPPQTWSCCWNNRLK